MMRMNGVHLSCILSLILQVWSVIHIIQIGMMYNC